MRALLAVFFILAVAACGPRQVDISPGPDVGPDATLRVTNTHTQSVNVYVVQGGSEMLVGQVPANSTQSFPVHGINTSQAVTLRARSTDGTRNWDRAGVMLVGTYEWRVP